MNFHARFVLLSFSRVIFGERDPHWWDHGHDDDDDDDHSLTADGATSDDDVSRPASRLQLTGKKTETRQTAAA